MSEPISLGLAKFSEELANRFPKRLIKRYVLPSVVNECAEVFIRELTSYDCIEAAILADGLMSTVEKTNTKLAEAAERREQIRIAIVGIADRLPSGGVSYRSVNTGATPLGEINDWGKRVWDALEVYYNDVNGMPIDEFVSGLKEARIVGAFAPPNRETVASASDGRRAG